MIYDNTAAFELEPELQDLAEGVRLRIESASFGPVETYAVGGPLSGAHVNGKAFVTIANGSLKLEGMLAEGGLIGLPFSTEAQLDMAREMAEAHVVCALEMAAKVERPRLVWRRKPEFSRGVEFDGLKIIISSRFVFL